MSSPNVNGQRRLFPRTPILVGVEVDGADRPEAFVVDSLHFSGAVRTMVIHLSGDRPSDLEYAAIGQAIWAALS